MQRAAVAVILALGALPVRAQDADKEAEAAVAEFRQVIDDADSTPDDRYAAIRRVGKVRHERVLAALAPFLVAGPLGQRIVTVKTLAEFVKVPGAVRKLCAAYVDDGNAKTDMAAVRIVILQTLGTMKSAEGAPVVDAAIESTDVWIAKAAADAAGKIRVKSSVEPLLRVVQKLEGREGNQQIDTKDPLADLLADALQTSTDPKKRAQKWADAQARAVTQEEQTVRDVLKAPVIGALRSISRRKFTAFADWRTWWMSNRRTFAVPP